MMSAVEPRALPFVAMVLACRHVHCHLCRVVAIDKKHVVGLDLVRGPPEICQMCSVEGDAGLLEVVCLAGFSPLLMLIANAWEVLDHLGLEGFVRRSTGSRDLLDLSTSLSMRRSSIHGKRGVQIQVALCHLSDCSDTRSSSISEQSMLFQTFRLPS